jgi:hypothetical protein
MDLDEFEYPKSKNPMFIIFLYIHLIACILLRLTMCVFIDCQQMLDDDWDYKFIVRRLFHKYDKILTDSNK